MLLPGSALFKSYTRIKNIGLAGVADAETLTGEVTVALLAGLATDKGKSFDPVSTGGSVVFAGGAGSALVEGDQLIVTGGVEGKSGCGGAVIDDDFELDPHPVSAVIAINRVDAITFDTALGNTVEERRFSPA